MDKNNEDIEEEEIEIVCAGNIQGDTEKTRHYAFIESIDKVQGIKPIGPLGTIRKYVYTNETDSPEVEGDVRDNIIKSIREDDRFEDDDFLALVVKQSSWAKNGDKHYYIMECDIYFLPDEVVD